MFIPGQTHPARTLVPVFYFLCFVLIDATWNEQMFINYSDITYHIIAVNNAKILESETSFYIKYHIYYEITGNCSVGQLNFPEHKGKYSYY